MENNSPHLKVLLDHYGTIVEFENTLECCKTNDDEFIGKNWFQTFIEDDDLDKIYDVFVGLVVGETKKWKSFKNNIKINNQDISLDFDNEVITKGKEKFIYSVGVVHPSQE